MSNKVRLHIGDVLRANAVKRWQIVDINRNQSLAEHTYSVVVIAMELCQRMKIDQITMSNVVLAAIQHDLPEVVTGDIPTPVKRVLGIKERLENIEKLLTFCDASFDDYGSKVAGIVKQADILESCWFLHLHRANTAHADSVYRKLVCRLRRYSDAWLLWQELLTHVPVEIDDIMGVPDGREA